MPTMVYLSVHLHSKESLMVEGQLSGMPTMVYLSVHLPATESPMAEGLASRHANNGRSKYALTSYRKSDGGGVTLPTCQQW